MCAGEEGGDIVTNTIIFNPANNQLVSTINGIASSTFITTDTGDVTLVGDLLVGSVTYPAGTSLHTVLGAIVSINHAPASVAVGSNPALSANPATQVFNLNLSTPGSYDSSISGLTATSIKGAIDEIAANASAFPEGSAGDILIHSGVEFIPCEEVVDLFSGFSGVGLTLSSVPASFSRVSIYRNGILMMPPGDYTRTGAIVTLFRGATSETITAIYYRPA